MVRTQGRNKASGLGDFIGLAEWELHRTQGENKATGLAEWELHRTQGENKASGLGGGENRTHGRIKAHISGEGYRVGASGVA